MLRLMGRLLVFVMLVGALLVAFDLLVIGNTQVIQLTLPGLVLQAGLGLIVFGALAVGIVLAWLMLLPGRVRTARLGQRLNRYAQRLEGELLTVHARQERLRSNDHEQMVPTTAPTKQYPPLAALPRTGPIVRPPEAPVTAEESHSDLPVSA